MRIRPATLKDCPTCVEIGKMPELVTPQGKPAPLWWYQGFVKEKQIFFVAVEKERIVGYILGERCTGNVAFAHLVGVLPAFRGRGIASKLFDAFEKECRRRKLVAIVGYQYSKGEAVHKLLRSHGYDFGAAVIEFSKML